MLPLHNSHAAVAHVKWKKDRKSKKSELELFDKNCARTAPHKKHESTKSAFCDLMRQAGNAVGFSNASEGSARLKKASSSLRPLDSNPQKFYFPQNIWVKNSSQ